MTVMMDPNLSVFFVLRVSFSDKQKAKDLKCFWNPNLKKWVKEFFNRGKYDVDLDIYYSSVKRFIEKCKLENLVIESSNGLNELEEYYKNFGAE